MEGLLLQAHKKLQERKQREAASLLNEVYDLMPFRARPPPSLQSVSQKLDVCQVALHKTPRWAAESGALTIAFVSADQRRSERE